MKIPLSPPFLKGEISFPLQWGEYVPPFRKGGKGGFKTGYPGEFNMPMVYHLKLSKKSIKGARIALLPGDPGRVPAIASAINNEGASEIASNREFKTWLSVMDSNPVVVTSTGIGRPCAALAT